MEARMFQTRRFRPYIDGSQKYRCKWSSDDRVAILTLNEVIVYSIVHKMTEVDVNNYLKLSSPSFIYARQEITTSSDDLDSSDEFFDLKRQDYLNTRFPDDCEMDNEIRDVFWSPKNLINPNQCMLAVITSDGVLELAAQADDEWISVHDFTTQWNQIINPSDDNESLAAHKSNSNRLFCTTSAWSCCYKDNDQSNYAYFISAYESSEIAIWKVKGINSEDIGLDLKMDIELKFKYKLQNTAIISALSWIEIDKDDYMLLVGFSDSHIDCLKINKHKSEILMSFCEPILNNSNYGPVNSIQLVEQKDNFIDVVVINECILSTLRINTKGNMISMKCATFPFAITGASHIEPDLMLVTTIECNMLIVKNLQNQKEIIYTEIKSDLPKDGLQYLGLGCSQNKVIFSVICSPAVVHDALANRQPSSINFFSLFDPFQKDLVLTLISKPTLQDHWDFLELIKVNMLKNNDISLNLKKLISNLEKLSFHECRVAYWIMSFILVAKQSNEQEGTNLQCNVNLAEQIETAKSYILSYSASERLKYLSQQEKLNDYQKMSIYLLQCHLNVWLAGEDKESEDKELEMPLIMIVKEALKATSQFEDVQQENCDKCNVPILEPWAESCSSGHFLERCPITGLQVHEVRHRLCSICHQLYHPCLDVEIDEMKCLYCHLPVMYDTNIPFESLHISEKNLSRPNKGAFSDNEFLEDIDD
ncbi:hypothetical protein TKK_0002113 [Trichogramma kaykai]|uniref:Transcription factor IIIC 90kDa subunit N-terminal domain-containing protein n=1 Tax=Trichogramma kaykai TaxID=54128 RepID=A0ABD2XAX3_9HYME